MTPASAATELPKLDEFLTGRPEERLTDLLAYALAVEAGSGQGGAERFRLRAAAELADHAARTMHNRIEEIRREAVSEHLGSLRRPLGLFGAVLANLLALAVAGAAAAWLSGQPALLARLLSWFGA